MLTQEKIEGIVQFCKLYKHLLEKNDLNNLYIAEQETRNTLDRKGGWDRNDLTRFLINLNKGSYHKVQLMLEDKIPAFWITDDEEIISITISSNIKTIGRWAFAECSNLVAVNLNQVEVIRGRAFANSNLKHIIIPESMQTIYRNAFLNNPLYTIHFAKDCNADIDSSIFAECNQIREIRCNEFIKKQLPESLQEKVILL